MAWLLGRKTQAPYCWLWETRCSASNNSLHGLKHLQSPRAPNWQHQTPTHKPQVQFATHSWMTPGCYSTGSASNISYHLSWWTMLYFTFQLWTRRAVILIHIFYGSVCGSYMEPCKHFHMMLHVWCWERMTTDTVHVKRPTFHHGRQSFFTWAVSASAILRFGQPLIARA